MLKNDEVLMTFVVPVYNAEPYLSECLESILKQDVSKEIICINDGSTDQSLSILQEYARKYYEIHIIDKKNEGVAIARNIGIDNAKGKYLWFVDADDYLLCRNLNYFCQLAEQHQIEIVRGGIYRERPSGTTRHFAYFREVEQANLENRHFSFIKNTAIYLERGITVGYMPRVFFGFYLTEFIRKNNIYFQNLKTSEDELFELKCLTSQLDTKILETTEPFYFYRNTPKSLSKNKNYQKIVNILQLMPEIEHILKMLFEQLEKTDEKDRKQEQDIILLHILIKAVNFILHKINRYALLELFKDLPKKEQNKLKEEIPTRYIEKLKETFFTMISIPNSSQYFGAEIQADIELLWRNSND